MRLGAAITETMDYQHHVLLEFHSHDSSAVVGLFVRLYISKILLIKCEKSKQTAVIMQNVNK